MCIRDRSDVLGELESGLGVDGRCHFETLEPEHARERISHRPVVVDDEDRLRGGLRERALGRGNHRIIMKVKGIRVKLPG